jgi:transposase
MVFVRPISDAEGRELPRLARRSRDSVVARRAAVVLCSAQGMSVPQITGTIFADPGHIRSVLKDFNERGFAALLPGRSPGRPRRIDEQRRERIVAIALSRPHDLGLPFTHWSLPKLRDRQVAYPHQRPSFTFATPPPAARAATAGRDELDLEVELVALAPRSTSP